MKRHVALVIPTLVALGGAERIVLGLAEELVGRGWRVTVVMLADETPPQRKAWMAGRGIEWLALGMRKAWIDPCGWRVFLDWQRREQPDVLHGHLAHGAWFVRVARLVRAGAKPAAIVDTLHSTRVGGRWAARLYRVTDRMTGRVTAVSEAVWQAAVEARIVSRKRTLCVVTNGIEIERFTARRHRPEDEFVWLTVGRLATVKDYPRLLRAFALVLQEAKRATRLEIAGDGSEMERLQAMAQELGIAAHVRWHGFCENVSALYANTDAVALASRWEGLPVSLIEAGAAELPVVTTATAGALEVVVPEETGLVAQGNSDAALARAMLRLMEMSAEDRQRIGASARRRVLERFTMERMIEGYERVYLELLG